MLEWASESQHWVQPSCRPARCNEALHALHQQGQAGEPAWRRSRDRLGVEAAEMEVKIYES